ncbi:unnamed protein product [Diatraea saccharalis]|uniref:G-protein coupled receptors family 3 profile domain-containing protein n=1 Tax=Diatraea saccharalis TaxID=40085 RepID=A0A9N9WCN7_9NEOP|nr:unnamed protein product [Diatraea saccharalis]
MYTTCVIWLAFVPLYFGTASHVPLRVTSMAVTISLSASVTLVCLFSPKLYIILIRPERNVRQSIMPVRYSRKPPHQHSLLPIQNKKTPCADKETQTEAADFKKLSNGQTVPGLQDTKETTEEPNMKEDNEPIQCNNITAISNNSSDRIKQANIENVKINNPNDKIINVNITNDKADTL